MWEEIPCLNGHEFNPAALVRAVNDLFGRGEEAAARLIRDQARALDQPAAARAGDGFRALGRLHLVVRTLWCPAPPHPAWPELHLGRPDIALPRPDATWPASPLVFSDDWPFLLVGGFKLGGGLLAATVAIGQLLAMARWREQALAPIPSPLAAMQRLVDSSAWRSRVPPDQQAQAAEMLKTQALRAMGGEVGCQCKELWGCGDSLQGRG